MIRVLPRSRSGRAVLTSVLDSIASAFLGAGAMAFVVDGSLRGAGVVGAGWALLVVIRATFAFAEAR